MDVINMSLGSPFGIEDEPSAVASTNAAKDGVIVVTSAGNSGPSQYIAGSPGTADGAICHGGERLDAVATPASLVRRSPGTALALHAINANGCRLHRPDHGPARGAEGQPGDDADLADSSARPTSRSAARRPRTRSTASAGKIASPSAGRAPASRKAIFGQQAGAAAV